MATIEKRISRNGKTTTWRVKWRTGGRRTGAWDGETCDDVKTARVFKALVEVIGEERSAGFPRGCRGRKIEDGAVATPDVLGTRPGRNLPGLTEDQSGPDETGPTFENVFQEYLERLQRLQKIEPRQPTDYRRSWKRHVADAVVPVPGKGLVGPLKTLPVREVTAEVIDA